MPTELTSLLIDKGVLIALLAWLYWQERKERRAAQKALQECLAEDHELREDQ